MLTALCGVTLIASFVPDWSGAGYASVAFGSYFALSSAWRSIRDREVDVNLLMVLAAIGAIVVGHVDDAAILLFLFSLSSTMESLALARAKSAIEGLMKLRPDTAHRVTDSGDEIVPLAEIRRGDTIRVLPFESIPVDGDILEGTTSVDESAMTGESVPVMRSPGSRVLAGTQNLEGMVLAKVTSPAGDTTLEKIVELVRDAQENKASGERISAWFGKRYTAFVLSVFVISLAVRGAASGGDWNQALAASITLLVALSPCALVISTPAATLSALTWGARNGLLIRGGEFIETAGRVDTVVVDKTGTLTAGKPELVALCVCDEASPETSCRHEDLCWSGGKRFSPEASRALALAAAVEQYSSHPIAEAIMRQSALQGIPLQDAEQHEVLPGLGLHAWVGGREVSVGRPSMFEGLAPDGFLHHVREFTAQGMTVSVMRSELGWAALGFRDQVRNEAATFLGELKALGVTRVAMLTGDSERTATAVAKQLGLTEVRAGLMPNQKTEEVSALSANGRNVMMVGDGVNDAPALAKASVGVAMGGLGSDIALSSADVVLMQDRLTRIPDLIRLGRRTNGIIRANLVFAAGVICVLTLASLTVSLPLPVAVIGHEGSTVLVILNGLRLLSGPNRSRRLGRESDAAPTAAIPAR